MLKRIVKKAVAGAAAAAAAFVAVGALGFTLFYALRLVFVPVGAAAITFLVFAVAAGVIVTVFLKDPDGADHEEEDDHEPHSLASRAVHLIRERPIMGAVGGLGALFLLLRNPAMAAIAASLITERRMERKGYRRR